MPQTYQLGNVFVTPNGEVFFTDQNHHRVRKILRTGETVTICGTGIAGYNGDDQPATHAQLNTPSFVLVSSRDEVYISEANGHRIRKIKTNGNITTVAGTGAGGYNGDDIPATEAMINHPYGLFVSEDKNELYIADAGNHLIRKVSPSGIVSTVLGQVTTTGKQNLKGLMAQTTLNYPSGVFVTKSNEMFISEPMRRIRKVNSNGAISNIVTTSDDDVGTFISNNPLFITVSHHDELYIADCGNDRIRKVSNHGKVVTIAGSFTGGYNEDGILATHAKLFGPTGVFVTSNSSGEIYISEFNGCRIRKVNSHGIISTISGTGTPGYSGDIPFDFQRYPHIGKKTIRPFPRSYFDISIQCN